MKIIDSPHTPQTQSDLRKFGLILASCIIGFFGLLFPLLHGKDIQLMTWPWLLALVLAVVSLASPAILRPLYTAWMFLGKILGFINTRIILGVIYLVFFTPAALALKLLHRDPMQRNFDAEAPSYRTISRQPNIDNLNRPY